MTDRELLELAAKASYTGIVWAITGRISGCDIPRLTGTVNQWNPLADDGDALGLAVTLHLWEAIQLAHRLLGEDGCPDMYAATRRAIVRAAAEIGAKE